MHKRNILLNKYWLFGSIHGKLVLVCRLELDDKLEQAYGLVRGDKLVLLCGWGLDDKLVLGLDDKRAWERGGRLAWELGGTLV